MTYHFNLVKLGEISTTIEAGKPWKTKEEKDRDEQFHQAFVKFIPLKKKIEAIKTYEDFVEVFHEDKDNSLKEYCKILSSHKTWNPDYALLSTAMKHAIRDNSYGLENNFPRWAEQLWNK